MQKLYDQSNDSHNSDKCQIWFRAGSQGDSKREVLINHGGPRWAPLSQLFSSKQSVIPEIFAYVYIHMVREVRGIHVCLWGETERERER